ncbi:hypothetical protein EVAR_66617_1 [Eumeta japonica]|uniref:Uncharacterized protein n=1 Tax=Eumeta variegata TaxID=151549 RepID=A0A4C2A6C8_EUMVA|nr:hypothetical protein EVAR_66617_1 [Eumeta japonica]
MKANCRVSLESAKRAHVKRNDGFDTTDNSHSCTQILSLSRRSPKLIVITAVLIGIALDATRPTSKCYVINNRAIKRGGRRSSSRNERHFAAGAPRRPRAAPAQAVRKEWNYISMNLPVFKVELTKQFTCSLYAAAVSLLLGRIGRWSIREIDVSHAERLGRSCLSIACSALSLACSAQTERDNESCFFVRAAGAIWPNLMRAPDARAAHCSPNDRTPSRRRYFTCCSRFRIVDVT